MLLHGGFPMEVRVAAEVRAAVDAGFDVDVIALRRPGEAPVERAEGARVFRVPIRHTHGSGVWAVAREYSGFLVLAGLKAARLSLRHRYDIVQVHNPPDFLVAAAVGPRLRGARVILDVHDLATDMFEMRFRARRGFRLAHRLMEAIERISLRRVDAVLTVHEPYRQELISRGAAADDVTVVLNTLDERVLPDETEAIDSANGFSVVYHGTVTPHYGLELLVEAIALASPHIPDLHLRVYGEGDAIAGIRKRASELGVEQLIETLPHLPQRDVLRAIRSASVGVVPNLPSQLNRFALSTKLFEYVALGIPVICAELPTISSYFGPREVRFFTAGDARSLADALVDVARDPGAARERASAARDRYRDYRWAVNEKRYVELLERLLRR
jgi:glycosyltransferase involved in cell wall biosynthesis